MLLRSLALLAVLAAPAPAGQIIVPAPPPLVRPDGTPLSEPPRIVLPENSVRLDPSRPVLRPEDPEAAPLVKALERSEPVSGMLPPGQSETAAEAEKPARSAAAEAVEALQEAGAFDGARRMKAALEAESFSPAKGWSAAAKADVEDRLRAAARAPAPENRAIVRALFLKYGDRLDWTGLQALLARLAPPDDGAALRLRVELQEAFLRERGSELPPDEAARAAAVVRRDKSRL